VVVVVVVVVVVDDVIAIISGAIPRNVGRQVMKLQKSIRRHALYMAHFLLRLREINISRVIAAAYFKTRASGQ